MLPNRRYAPSDSELLFHYCPPDAFLAICASKTLRFTDVFSMSDFMELHWGHRVWTTTWPKLAHIPPDFIKKLDGLFFASGLQATPLACCFSLERDVLSQWRAYAADGVGFAVGFQADELIRLPARPLRILYDESKQLGELMEVVSALHEVESKAADKDSKYFHSFCLNLMLDFCAFKNPAFHEEAEIRLVHALSFEQRGAHLKLVDPGGEADGVSTPPQEIRFCNKRGILFPYMDLDFSLNGKCSPVRQVVIGPKNESRTSAISVFLETLGHHDVEVIRSSASYR